jgi:hypothetical protein
MSPHVEILATPVEAVINTFLTGISTCGVLTNSFGAGANTYGVGIHACETGINTSVAGTNTSGAGIHNSTFTPKEDIREQPTSRNLSATATRVLQCTCPVAAPRKYFSAIGALYCCQCSEEKLMSCKGSEITFPHNS